MPFRWCPPSGGNERPLSNTTVTQLFYSFGETLLRRKFGGPERVATYHPFQKICFKD